MRKLALASIWIILLNLFVATIFLGMLSQTINFIQGKDDPFSIITIGIFGSFISFTTYGLIVLIPLLAFLIITTLLFIRKETKTPFLTNFLKIEFFLVGTIFSYLAVVHNYPIWFYFIAIFGISQFRRYKYITKRNNKELV